MTTIKEVNADGQIILDLNDLKAIALVHNLDLPFDAEDQPEVRTFKNELLGLEVSASPDVVEVHYDKNDKLLGMQITWKPVP